MGSPPAAPTTGSGSTRFSIVTAVYNVARYLQAYIDSLEAQTFDLGAVEVIAVDDGSTDESGRMLAEWAARRPGLVRVLTKPNGGQSSARNLGLSSARGEWVTFLDPDDLVRPSYLAEVAGFLDRHPEVAMVATNRMMLADRTGEVTDTHPLRAHFQAGNKVRNLDRWPDHFHGSAPAAFFRLSTLRELGLTFDPRVRPNFEDGHFCCRYLLALPEPTVAFVASAHYLYRKRGDASSTLQTSLSDPDRYTAVLRHGYLQLLQQAETERGSAPPWLQSFVVYELSWYLSSQDHHAGVSSAGGSVAEEFHALMAEITRRLDPRLIEAFHVRPLRPVWRYVLQHGYAEQPWHQTWGLVSRLDADQSLVRVSYYYTGTAPTERLLSGGAEIGPVHAKTRDIAYHDRVLVYERLLWVPAGRALRLQLNGRGLDLAFAPPRRPVFTLTPTSIRAALGRSDRPHRAPRRRDAERRPGTRRRDLQDRLVLSLAGLPVVRHRFAGAWVVMDRIHDADDNGERLFRYLRRSRRDINAWFVLEAGTPDWERLRADGYRRLVAHGSLLWKLLMLNCQHVISSHADAPVINPPAIARLRPERRWRFTFLQHGVIKDDISTWLNPKPLDLFVVSTRPEYDSVAGDHSPYVFSSKEVKLTGLPRFDRLREIGRGVQPADRDLVLVAPTWRNWLLPALEKGSQRRVVPAEFLESDFVQQWLGFLRSPDLRRICAEQGLTLGFLPHPNLQSALPDLGLPDHVRPLSFTSGDVQRLIARSAVLVTDYSSMAFNAAYIDRPVVYFQFDQAAVLSGGHVGRAGYFSYDDDGFGPVATDVEGAVRAVGRTVAAGRDPQPPYAERIAATFGKRDGKCCARVTEAILRSTRPVRKIPPAGPARPDGPARSAGG